MIRGIHIDKLSSARRCYNGQPFSSLLRINYEKQKYWDFQESMQEWVGLLVL